MKATIIKMESRSKLTAKGGTAERATSTVGGARRAQNRISLLELDLGAVKHEGCELGARRQARTKPSTVAWVGLVSMPGVSEHIEFHQDLPVGLRVRYRRWMLGMSRKSLAEIVGETIDLIDAVERGEHELVGTLFQRVCAALEVSPSSLTQKYSIPEPGLPTEAASVSEIRATGLKEGS